MSDSTINTKTQSIQTWLQQSRLTAIERIVAKSRDELEDYRKRDINELREAVARSYDNWTESVLKNDFSLSQANSRRAIKENISRGTSPTQLARTPWIIYEVVTQILNEAGNQLDSFERLQFIRHANKLTGLIVTIGQFQIASTLVEVNTIKTKE
ncbi:MAG TPA: hypothetical protein VH186_32990 [Chloroflexia bacterium]|nr:hypothetical protein [Chloroflexia bacterium]